MSRDYEKARQIEQAVDEQQQLVIAFRKMTKGIADIDPDERQDMGLVETTFRALEEFQQMRERVAFLEGENQEMREMMERFEDIGAEKSSKEQKIAAIVTWAMRQAGDETSDRVAVTARDIIGCTGVTRRYAYDLIDDLPGEYEWMLDRSDVSQYGELEIEKGAQTRAVIVDCELLHEDDGAVNKFTTANAATEVAD